MGKPTGIRKLAVPTPRERGAETETPHALRGATLPAAKRPQMVLSIAYDERQGTALSMRDAGTAEVVRKRGRTGQSASAAENCSAQASDRRVTSLTQNLATSQAHRRIPRHAKYLNFVTIKAPLGPLQSSLLARSAHPQRDVQANLLNTPLIFYFLRNNGLAC